MKPTIRAQIVDLELVQQARARAHFAVHFANRELIKRTWSDAIYVAGRLALEPINVELHKAKWLLGRIDGTYTEFASPSKSESDLALAYAKFQDVISRADAVTKACRDGEDAICAQADSSLKRVNEIIFAGEVPLVPTICPVVVLQGSNMEMGCQYAQQVIEIYGSWIFEQQARRVLSVDEKSEMRKWEAELRQYIPEVLDFVKGWAEGATAAGVVMTYDNVLAIWAGTRPFSTEVRPMAFAQADKHDERITAAYLGVPSKKPHTELADMCSGVCAWGSGTTDGELVAASTTDHDCTYQATIVAFPSRGNNFIYTPFSVNGSIPVLGRFFMGGHPGMNSKGVAYIHHGGANTGEPKDEWGYGVRRGPATFHILQFANSAAEARDMQLNWPVGDTAISLGTAGGLFADKNYGFSLEARPGSPKKPNPIIREATYDAFGRGFDFLYANNNALSPRSGRLNAAPSEGYNYTLAGGWFTFDPKVIFSEPGGVAFRRLNTKNSEGRNRFHYRVMMEGYGRIDLEYLTRLYRSGGDIPPGKFDEVCERWHAGEQWNCSPAHRSNAFTVVMKPDDRNTGVYRGCVGPAERGLNCRDPGHGYYYYDETNAFWELRLAATPADVMIEAERKAAENVKQARDALSLFAGCESAAAELHRICSLAESEMQAAKGITVEEEDTDARLASLARRIRAFTRAQVRAAQVTDAIYPPHGVAES